MIRGAMPAGGTRPIGIFLVDDHRTILWGLERLIETASPPMAVVGTATSRAELFEQLTDANPDVILLDLDLNGENGLDCLDALGQQTSAKVLVLTSASDPGVHQQAIMQGARGVIHKQEPAEVILRAIEKVHNGEIWLDRASMGRVVTALAQGNKPDPEALKIATLTAKERQIIAMIIQEKGARNKVIAEKLHISEHTLRNNLTTIYSKLGVSGRLELYLYASTHRLHAG
jgi:two-component system, NarL family, nitrate/nitrite response regulator NarL